MDTPDHRQVVRPLYHVTQKNNFKLGPEQEIFKQKRNMQLPLGQSRQKM